MFVVLSNALARAYDKTEYFVVILLMIKGIQAKGKNCYICGLNFGYIFFYEPESFRTATQFEIKSEICGGS